MAGQRRGRASVSDDNGHGTHVSGIIAANTDNGISVARVAPGVSLMPIRVECGGSIYVSTEVNALHYAADNGARVISISLGGTSPSK
ncbi:MAG: S8 family serine peptidase [Dehalococcoidia bacterium]|nr:S8 family serine peptidase [Dehalococcoidia bacterium]